MNELPRKVTRFFVWERFATFGRDSNNSKKKIEKLAKKFTKTLTFKAFSCIIKISIKR